MCLFKKSQVLFSVPKNSLLSAYSCCGFWNYTSGKYQNTSCHAQAEVKKKKTKQANKQTITTSGYPGTKTFWTHASRRYTVIFLKKPQLLFWKIVPMKISKKEKAIFIILSRHDLYQLYCHLFNKYSLSTYHEPKLGIEQKTGQKHLVFWAR